MRSTNFCKKVEELLEFLQQFLTVELIRISKLRRKEIPENPGIYAIYAPNGQELIYIGSTNNLKRRIYTNHMKGNKKASTLRRKLFKKFGSEDKVTEFLEQCFVRFLPLDGMSEKMIKIIEHFFIAILEPDMND
ncbi:MAG: GIY-YIG nuclease family protein [Candidatus Asgardarchaeia archaeon]